MQSTAQRKAVELRALDEVARWLKSEGWLFDDTHASQPFDYRATKNKQTLYIEVKGTTTRGDRVIVTRGEVEHMRQHYPSSMLAVVSRIILAGTVEQPTASGGSLKVIHPWDIADAALVSIAYQYDVPLQRMTCHPEDPG